MLDLVITRAEDKECVSDLNVCGSCISDHFPLNFQTPWQKPKAHRKIIQSRKLKDVDLDKVQDDIKSSTLINSPPVGLDDLVNMYNKTLNDIMEKHAPVVEKEVIIRPRTPWFSEPIKKAKQMMRRAERKWRKSRSNIDSEILKTKSKEKKV